MPCKTHKHYNSLYTILKGGYNILKVIKNARLVCFGRETSGLHYKHIMIINDSSRVASSDAPSCGVILTTRGVIYDYGIFIIYATRVIIYSTGITHDDCHNFITCHSGSKLYLMGRSTRAQRVLQGSQMKIESFLYTQQKSVVLNECHSK